MKKSQMRAVLVSMILVISISLGALPMTVFAATAVSENKAVDPTKYLSETFFIQSVYSGDYLSVYRGKAASGTNVMQWMFNGDDSQKWNLKKQSNGTYQIVSALPGGYNLDITGNSSKNGANAQIWKSEQSFRLVKTSWGSYKLQSSASGNAKKTLGVEGSSDDDDSNVYQWDDWEYANDEWEFIRVETSQNETASQKKAVKTAKEIFKEYPEYITYATPATLFQMLSKDYSIADSTFSDQDALYGVNHCGINWNERALNYIKEYCQSYSQEEMVTYSLGDGFTQSQVKYALDRYTNWNQNAVERAEEELTGYNEINGSSSRSRQEVLNVLLAAKFTKEQATYGVDHCDADWNKQAQERATSKLESWDDDLETFYPRSRQEVLNVLLSAKFTKEQATYGVDHCGANWNKQATGRAKYYLAQKSYSQNDLVNKLVKDGFTKEQATYGANAAKK